MKLWRLVLLWLAILFLTACVLSSCAVSGKVVEDGTNKPIAGAFVAALWEGIVSVPGHAHQVCVHIEGAITDANGKYKFDRWSKSSSGFVSDLEPDVTSYKAGYGWPDHTSQKREVELLTPFRGTKEDRLKFLLRVVSATRCASAGSSSKNIYPMYKAIYEEAKSIAVTAEDWQTVDILREEAARAAVRPDGHLTSGEMNQRMTEFLKDNLK